MVAKRYLGRPAGVVQVGQHPAQPLDVERVGEMGQGLGHAAGVAAPAQGVQKRQQTGGHVRYGAKTAELAPLQHPAEAGLIALRGRGGPGQGCRSAHEATFPATWAPGPAFSADGDRRLS